MKSSNTMLLEMLVGEWIAEDQAAAGSFTFLPELQHTVYVRRNHATYAAIEETPAYEHDDLMIVYRDSQSHNFRAWYTDNEGHVIDYDVQFFEATKTVEFLSAVSAESPRYRLRYSAITANQLQVSFAIAPPGQPEAFTSYIESSVKRLTPVT